MVRGNVSQTIVLCHVGSGLYRDWRGSDEVCSPVPAGARANKPGGEREQLGY